jgi:hypothetical protein
MPRHEKVIVGDGPIVAEDRPSSQPLPIGPRHEQLDKHSSTLGEFRTRMKGKHRKQVGSRKRKRGMPLMAPPRLGTGIGGPQALKPPTMARIQLAPDGHHRLSTAWSALHH